MDRASKKFSINPSLAFALIVCFWTLALPVRSQTVTVDFNNVSLQKAFLALRDQHNIQFSYNDELVKNCRVSLQNNYSSVDKALRAILDICQLSYVKSGAVYVITKPALVGFQAKSDKPILYTYAGTIVDYNDYQPLPMSSVAFGRTGLITDEYGNFSFKTTDSLTKLSISYLGYYKGDTLLTPGKNHQLQLRPSSMSLPEVHIEDEDRIHDLHVGERPGLIKLNHHLAELLPGNFNNTVYNLLRLQSGVMAAGEQTRDYIVWGSFKGHNLIQFDHITLFNVGAFDDNTSAINSMMVKDIEVLKGGFGVDLSNRVGGVISMTGKTADLENSYADINLSNRGISGAINIPINDKLGVQAGLRRTYNDFLDFIELGSENESLETGLSSDSTVFQDINFKLSGELDSHNTLHVTLIGSSDEKKAWLRREDLDAKTADMSESLREQYGGSLVYQHIWKSGSSTQLSFAHSDLQTEQSSLLENLNRPPQMDTRPPNERLPERSSGRIAQMPGPSPRTPQEDSPSGGRRPGLLQDTTTSINVLNRIQESNLKINHIWSKAAYSHWKVGIEIARNKTELKRSRDGRLEENHGQSKAVRYGLFVQNSISATSKLNLVPGVRVDMLNESAKAYIQPRIQTSYQLHNNWRLNGAWGIYRQFITETALEDDLGDELYVWRLMGMDDTRTLEGEHITTGIVFSKGSLKLSVEGFYKQINNITRYLRTNSTKEAIVYKTQFADSRSRGIDFFAQLKKNKWSVWGSYTGSVTEENFKDRAGKQEWKRASHDQTHELKTVGMVNVSPFHLSLSYVYGSGLWFTRPEPERSGDERKPIPYRRLDFAAMHQWSTKRVVFKTGLSILNLTNQYNVRYTDFLALPDKDAHHLQSTPRSLMLNVFFGF